MMITVDDIVELGYSYEEAESIFDEGWERVSSVYNDSLSIVDPMVDNDDEDMVYYIEDM